MKYLFFALISATVLSCSLSDKKATSPEDAKRQQEAAEAIKDTANYTTIEWLDSAKQDLGQIKEGQVVEITWNFKNSGTHPLFIEKVQAGCGCTVASAPKEPIAPGQEQKITAKFDSDGKPGHQDKGLTVYANIKNHNNGNDTQLRFTADVKE